MMPKLNIFYAIFFVLVFIGCSKEESTTYSVTLNTQPSEGGQVAPANLNSINEGQRITLTATVNDGYAFTGWEGTLNEKAPTR